MLRPQHECTTEAGIRPLAVCPDGSVGASDIFILVTAIVLLAAGGYVLWLWMRRRYQE